MSKSGLLKSSLAKKYWMAFTGLFLCLFLAGHLAGNLQLFVGGEEGKTMFNEYAKFMTTNPLVKILSYLTYISIIFHAIDGLILTLKNSAARPQKYAYNKPSANSIWSSRNMGILGTIILVFIIGHMCHFWAQMHFAEMPMQGELKDLHKIVLDFFNPNENSLALGFTLFYVIAMIAVAFHLYHGFQSAFQSLGISHRRYTPIIKKLGYGFAIVIPAAFASIPVYLFLNN